MRSGKLGMNYARRLGLGTVQFGQAYGISNTRGQVPGAEASAMLRRAAEAGIGVLDTAANYGASEAVLGANAALTGPFRVVTKTIGVAQGIDAVMARARASAETLKRRPVELLLVHAAGDLTGPDGPALWHALLGLRDEGLFGGIGISAYVADDPAALAAQFRPAAMQVPFSLLDQRLLRDGSLARMKDLGVEVHTRSAFLQGLLFLDPERLPQKLRGAAAHLAALRKRIADAGATPLQAALAFVLAQREVDVAVVGATSAGELDEIADAANAPAPEIDWDGCALDDEIVLTPSLW